MRSLVVAFLLALVPAAAGAQPDVPTDTSEAPDVTGVEYTRLDHLQFDRASLFSGERGQVTLSLVELRSVDTGQVVRGVEVNVSKRKNRVVGGSLALSSIGSLFGASSDVTYRRIRDSGHVFLRGEDLSEVVGFLDKTVQAIGQEQTEMKIYKVSLQRGFEFGMMYDPSAAPRSDDSPTERPRWKFIVTAKDATYRLDYQNGLNVVRRLSAWENRLSGE
jgi:hypothetical protein